MKNLKEKFAAVALGLALCISFSDANAQLGGLTKSLGVGGSGASVSADQIVGKYVTGSQHVNKAEVKMLKAVGLKDQADLAELQAKNLTAGATSSALEEAAKVQTDSSKALEDAFKQAKVEMDAKSKKQFSDGMADLGRGIVQYAGMSGDMKNFSPNPTAIGAATTSAVYIVKNLPASLKSLGSTLKGAVDFAKTNNIPVPKEAADATALL
jgi:hypothetical protein